MEQPKNPFANMTTEERKRTQERILLEFAYRVGEFDGITDRERPDFALHWAADSIPIGVEITQLFPDESHARLHMLPGYMESLWEGGRHRHKDDVETLSVATGIVVTDPDGKVKTRNLTGIVTKPHHWCLTIGLISALA